MATNASKSDTVKVKLPRPFLWNREGASKPDRYGPGWAEIPRAMAEGLVKAGALEADALGGKAEAADEPQGGSALSDLYFIVEGLANRVGVVEGHVKTLLGERESASSFDATEGALALAKESGFDLSTVQGTGENGRITKADVEAALKAK